MARRSQRTKEEIASILVIGIDFGTTYSGIAWSHSAKPSVIGVTTNWGGGHNTDKGKCPTRLTYGSKGVRNWGYEANRDDNAFMWFKLLLLEEGDLEDAFRNTDVVRRARQTALLMGKTPTQLVTDFLRELWKFTLKKISKTDTQALIDNATFHVVLSVPAIWPDYAKDRMREAAAQAGICDHREAGKTTLDLISEPEAAALATMMDKFEGFEKTGTHLIEPGDCFVVVDAGGGTLDLITYRVITTKPWKVEECVRGDGALCGAVTLDEGFYELVDRKIPAELRDSIDTRAAREEVFDMKWERIIKREFGPKTSDQVFRFPYQHKTAGKSREGICKISITKSELEAIFERVVTKVSELVVRQISQIPRERGKQGCPARYVVLVGGLGSSSYLFNRLNAILIDEDRGGPEIIQSEGELPWTAIARGAVIHGFSQQKLRGNRITGAPNFGVQSRIARCSYGTACTFEVWDPKLGHREEDRRYDPVEGRNVADNQMSWFVQANKPLYEAEERVCDFSVLFGEPEAAREDIVSELFYSHAKKPPRRMDKTVKKLCEVRWSKNFNYNRLPLKLRDDGTEVREVSYQIRMTFRGASCMFSVWHDGEQVAKRDVAVDFADCEALQDNEDEDMDYVDET